MKPTRLLIALLILAIVAPISVATAKNDNFLGVLLPEKGSEISRNLVGIVVTFKANNRMNSKPERLAWSIKIDGKKQDVEFVLVDDYRGGTYTGLAEVEGSQGVIEITDLQDHFDYVMYCSTVQCVPIYDHWMAHNPEFQQYYTGDLRTLAIFGKVQEKVEQKGSAKWVSDFIKHKAIVGVTREVLAEPTTLKEATANILPD